MSLKKSKFSRGRLLTMGFLLKQISVIDILSLKLHVMCGHWSEDCFHACVQCPHAVALRHAMRKHWALPAEEDLLFTGPDWLLVLMSRFTAEVNSNLLMLLWRVWSVRNSVLRAGQKVSVAGSIVFLTRYMDSLLQCHQGSSQHDAEGKRVCTCGEQAPLCN